MKIKKIGLVCGIVLAISCAGCVVAAEGSDTEIYGANPQYDRAIPHTDYIIADSDQRYLTKDDVRGLSLRAINYAKNEIFARRGRKFLSNELQTYFNSKDWYCGIYEPGDFEQYYMDDLMNNYEKVNAEFLSGIEYSISPEGYLLDVYDYSGEYEDTTVTYDVILAEYRRAVAEGFSGDYKYVGGYFKTLFYAGQPVYYAICDLLEDGMPELVIGIDNQGTDYAIVDFYSTDGTMIQNIDAAEDGHYLGYELCEGDIVLCSWTSGGLSAGGRAFYQLYPNEAVGEKIEEIWHNGSGICFYIDTVTDGIGSEEEYMISREEYDAIEASYPLVTESPFEWKKLS